MHAALREEPSPETLSGVSQPPVIPVPDDLSVWCPLDSMDTGTLVAHRNSWAQNIHQQIVLKGKIRKKLSSFSI